MAVRTSRMIEREKLSLLDEVLDRFLPEKEDRVLYKDRVTATRILPTQKITDLVAVPARRRFTSERMQSLPGAPRPVSVKRSADAGPPLPSMAATSSRVVGGGSSRGTSGAVRSGTPTGLVAGRDRTKRVRDGKALLEATTQSMAPVFREVKPLQLTLRAPEDSPDETEDEDDELSDYEGAGPAGGDRMAADALGDASEGARGSNGTSAGGVSDAKRGRSQRRSDRKHHTFAIDLMMTLNSENLLSLKQQFAKFRGELDVVEFVAVMQQHLPRGLTDDEQVALVANLSELFAQVDVNGDEKLEWEELTSFIVEEERSGSFGEAPLPKYKQVDPVIDQGRIRSEQSIEKVFYVPALDILVLCERPAPLVSVYNPKGFDCLHELKGHKAEVLAIEHIEEVGCLVTSGADLALCWWDVASPTSPTWRLRQRAALQHSQLSLRWCPARSCLFTGGAEGTVSVWDVVALQVTNRLTGHEDAVTDMVLCRMPKQLLATASLDRCIRLWDITGDNFRCCHCLGPPKVGLAPPFGQNFGAPSASGPLYHERGVTCLTFSSTHRHLYSGGCDHELLVWNPLSEQVICNLRQHASPLTAVEAVKHSPQVVSADLGGFVCIWDTRSLSCSQKLSLSIAPGQELTAMCLLPVHRQIIVACRRLSTFEGPQEPEPELTDSSPILAGLYNAKSCTFCTASGSSIMIWDALTGRLGRTVRDLFSTPITAMCFDDRERKLIVADHSGSVKVLNYSNGAVMKSMVSHGAEVSALLYVPSRRYVLSTSWDKTIALQDESPQDEGKMIRCMHSGHATDVTTAALSTMYMFMATGADDGSLQVLRMDERSIPHPHYELRGHRGCITALCFLEPWPLLASADSTGTVRIWSTRSNVPWLRFRQLLMLVNRTAKEWAAPWMRAASVQVNSRNTDGTLSEAIERVASVRNVKIEGYGRKEGDKMRAPPTTKDPAKESPGGKQPPASQAADGPGSRQASPLRISATAASAQRDAPPLRRGPSGAVGTATANAEAATFLTEVEGGDAGGAASGGTSGDASGADGVTSPPVINACAVTAMSFSTERQTLTWGDDQGRIVVWDLGPLIKVLPIPEGPGPDGGGNARASGGHGGQAKGAAGGEASMPDAPGRASAADVAAKVLGAMIEPGSPSGMSPRRRLSVRGRTGAEKRLSGTSSARESAWLLSRLQGTVVTIVHMWQAHEDAISSLVMMSHPPALLSTSADRLATVWKFDGTECYGSLRRGGPLKGTALARFQQSRAKRLGKHARTGVPKDFGPTPPYGGSASGGGGVAAAMDGPSSEGAPKNAAGHAARALQRGRSEASHSSEWCFPADAMIPQQMIMERAATILQKVSSEGFQSRMDSLETPAPSEMGEEPPLTGSGSSTGGPPLPHYEPRSSSTLCHDLWSRSRSPERLLGQHASRPASARLVTPPDLEEPLAPIDMGEMVDTMVGELKAKLLKQRARVSDMFQSIDTDHNGKINIHELQEALAALAIYAQPAAIEALFYTLDYDGSGEIDFHELHNVFRREAPATHTAAPPPPTRALPPEAVAAPAAAEAPAEAALARHEHGQAVDVAAHTTSADPATESAAKSAARRQDVHSTSTHPHLKYTCDYCEGTADERRIKTTVRFHLPGKDLDCCARCYSQKVPPAEQAAFVRVVAARGTAAIAAGSATPARAPAKRAMALTARPDLPSQAPRRPGSSSARRASPFSPRGGAAALSLTAPALDSAGGDELVLSLPAADPQGLTATGLEPMPPNSPRRRGSVSTRTARPRLATGKMANSSAAERLDLLLAADIVPIRTLPPAQPR